MSKTSPGAAVERLHIHLPDDVVFDSASDGQIEPDTLGFKLAFCRTCGRQLIITGTAKETKIQLATVTERMLIEQIVTTEYLRARENKK